MVSLADWRRLGEPLLKPAQVCAVPLVTMWERLAVLLCVDELVELAALVATRATGSLCSATKLVCACHSIEMRPTQSVLHHSGGGSILLRRFGKPDFLSIRLTQIRDINAISFSTMKREVLVTCLLLKSDFSGHLRRNHRHEVNGHAEYDNRCEICVKSIGISRHHPVVCTLSLARSTMRVSLSKSLTVTSQC